MYKIIKIDNNIVYIGKESDFNFIEIPIDNFGFEPVVGNYVEFYKNDSEYIVSKIDAIEKFTNNRVTPNQKSKLVAGLLAILFLGNWGFHWFYLGYSTRGAIRLVLWLATFWTGIGFVAMFIWSIIDGILILTSQPGSKWHQDANGVELQD